MPRTADTNVVTHLTNEVIDTIVALIADGNFLRTACRVVGVKPDTCTDWLEIGNEVKAAKANGRKITSFSQHQRRCLRFANAIDQADAQGEKVLVERVNLAGQPRRVRKITIRREPVRVRGEIQRHPNGDVVYAQHTTTEEHEEFDWRAALEVLKRRYGHRWGDKTEISGPQGGPIQMRIPEQPTDRQTMGEIADAFVAAGLMSDDERAAFDADRSSPNGQH